MEKKIKIIELNRSDKSQKYDCLPISENLVLNDLVKIAMSLCKKVMRLRNVPYAMFDIPADIRLSKDFFIDEATINIYYGRWNMN